jgi:protein gp37
MSKDTKIEWADHTFNPWIGCTKISPACDNCYAERSMPAKFQGITWGSGQPRKRTSAEYWKQPLRWNKEAERTGTRPRVFCASLADWADNEVPVQWRIDLLNLIGQTPNLDWLLLTKRIGNARQMLDEACRLGFGNAVLGWANNPLKSGPILENVWIGVTVCNQIEADRDIPKLLEVAAVRRFVSIEPLLGPVDLKQYLASHDFGVAPPTSRAAQAVKKIEASRGRFFIDWVIVGGESGPQARPMHPEWARSLRDQAVAAGVAFFFKQWGAWRPTWGLAKHLVYPDGQFIAGTHDHPDAWKHKIAEPMYCMRKKDAGRRLDGREWDEIPT